MNIKFLITICLIGFTQLGFSQSFSITDCRWDDPQVAAPNELKEYCVLWSVLGSGDQDAKVNFQSAGGTADGWIFESARIDSSLTNTPGEWTVTNPFGTNISFAYTDPFVDGEYARFCVSARASSDPNEDEMNSGQTNVVPGQSSCNSNIPIDHTQDPIPIVLVSFDAVANGSNADLTWVTASETNNSHFNIERSTDGVVFQTIGVVVGAGTTTAQQEYSYTDVNAASNGNEVYYRLEQVDIDGETDFSEIEVVNFSGSVSSKMFPNPAYNGEDVIIQGDNIESVSIFSVTGQLQKDIELDNNSTATISTDGLAAGTYIIIINGIEKRKLVVGK